MGKLTLKRRIELCVEILFARNNYGHLAHEKQLSLFLNGYDAGFRDGKSNNDFVTMPEKDHRVTFSEEGVATVMMGCGGIILSDTYAVDGSFSGVCFTLGSGEINQKHKNTYGKTEGEINAFLRVCATKPESLQVLIDKLTLAKDNFGLNYPPELNNDD